MIWKCFIVMLVAAGTGKAVNVGACGIAGTFLTVKIHKLDERLDRPDAIYTTDHLEVWGGLFDVDGVADHP
jgi:hypothetical protein